MTRALNLINVALVVALIGGSLLAWPDLPERIPTHFGVTGKPDKWSDRSPASWFMLPAIAVLVAALTHVSGRLTARHPRLLSIPGKEEFEKLGATGKAAVMVHVQAMLAFTMTVMLLIFAMIQLAIWRQAHGHPTTTLLALVLVGAVASTPLLLGLFLPRIQDEIERQKGR